jgi:hypothetical protein
MPTINWNEIVAQTNRTWLVQIDESEGMPLDWSGERSLSVLTEKGVKVLPAPGQTIDTLLASKILKL